MRETPLWPLAGPAATQRMGTGTEVLMKLELFQPTGTFKVRGAINNLLALDEAGRAAGVTTISAGNHAIATAYAAHRFGVSAKVVMMKEANPARVAAARAYGAEVIVADSVEHGFALLEGLKQDEGRTYIPSFPNERVVCGTGTIALELFEQAGTLDAIVVPIGGGGLISGISAAAKLISPTTRIYGIEPEKAGVVGRSVKSGTLQTLATVDTIADSLAAPMTNEVSVSFVSRFVDELVTISDDAMTEAAALLFGEAKLAVEAAGAASTAALMGPLRQELAGKRVALIVCGANIDPPSYCKLLQRGTAPGG
ncbi:MAG: pyridoxal-phosphate dependent enzyme [Candidatus Andeanibacterium colombiense]|uniref:Pyridoxal-phosphate dependent enzyme n=1 Tax=Candidatus Andeanibacterium colombiense TaxID=3121345 RepID=A0AAJ6BNS2_9SPHN|nr:MAG: pyridoxal-phosphate dependent enzyme [Sphingomonadaceae bacterium]